MNRIIFLLSVIFATTSVAVAQNKNTAKKPPFDPFKIEADHYDTIGAKNEQVFTENGIKYRIVFTPSTRGIEIYRDGQWLKHGIFYGYSDGKLTSKFRWEYGKREGEYEAYFPGGEPKFIGSYSNNLKTGIFYHYMNPDWLWEKTNYVDGQKNGEELVYYSNGKVQYKYNYVNGEREGKGYKYNEKGELENTWVYKKDQKIK